MAAMATVTAQKRFPFGMQVPQTITRNGVRYQGHGFFNATISADKFGFGTSGATGSRSGDLKLAKKKAREHGRKIVRDFGRGNDLLLAKVKSPETGKVIGYAAYIDGIF